MWFRPNLMSSRYILNFTSIEQYHSQDVWCVDVEYKYNPVFEETNATANS